MTGARVPVHPIELTGLAAGLEPLSAARHGDDLFAGFTQDPAVWDYMAAGPFESPASLHDWLRACEGSRDPLFFAIRDPHSGRAAGMAAFLHIEPRHRVIEIGHICLAPALQKSRAATEALALMIGWAFDAGYRRCEWKCDARNLASHRAAARLGFSYEGLFRQHMIVKGQNRDTAWFSVIDSEWPARRQAFARWLSADNFGPDGQQRLRLSALTGRLQANNTHPDTRSTE